jgi:DNA-binding transcriptional ArsR family regulator
MKHFGPGAQGVGWDLGLHGLELHLADPAASLDPEAFEAWTKDEGKKFVRGTGEAWAPHTPRRVRILKTRGRRPNEHRVLHGRLMHAFDVLGDPVRRRILEPLAAAEHASGEVVQVISSEFGITQPAISQQLKVLRDSGFATVRAEGTRRVYAIDTRPLAEVDAWLVQFRRFWGPPLEALATEIARGKRSRKKRG